VGLGSLVSNGCIISGGTVTYSILSPYVRVETNAEVSDSVLLEGVVVAADAKIRKAIIDKYVRVPKGANIGYNLAEDAKKYTVSKEGIVVIPKNYEFRN
jgi:glucose-1-phosphate adenylyltransferase